MGAAGRRRRLLAAGGEGAVRPGGTLGVLIGLHDDRDAWLAVWADFARFYPFSADWAWDALPCEQLWALIQHLPPESAFYRHRGVPNALEENVATLLDLLFHQVVGGHQRATFDPDAYSEHARRAQLAREARRRGVAPPDIPPVQPVAVRPAWALQSLTSALTALREPEIEEIEGHEAHVRLQELLNQS